MSSGAHHAGLAMRAAAVRTRFPHGKHFTSLLLVAVFTHIHGTVVRSDYGSRFSHHELTPRFPKTREPIITTSDNVALSGREIRRQRSITSGWPTIRALFRQPLKSPTVVRIFHHDRRARHFCGWIRAPETTVFLLFPFRAQDCRCDDLGRDKQSFLASGVSDIPMLRLFSKCNRPMRVLGDHGLAGGIAGGRVRRSGFRWRRIIISPHRNRRAASAQKRKNQWQPRYAPTHLSQLYETLKNVRKT
jgi:hypothetical protein